MEDTELRRYKNGFVGRLRTICNQLKTGPGELQALQALVERPMRKYAENPAVQWEFLELFKERMDALINDLAWAPVAQAYMQVACAAIMRESGQMVHLVESEDFTEIPLQVGSEEFRLRKKDVAEIVRGNCAACAYFYAKKAQPCTGNSRIYLTAQAEKEFAGQEMKLTEHYKNIRIAKKRLLAQQNG